MMVFPKEILKIIGLIEGAGGSAFILGGSLRDKMLGKEPKDWDMGTDIPSAKLAKLFKLGEQRGISYGVVSLEEGGLSIEIASLRSEAGYSDYRRPDLVEFISSIEEDLSRRDFTVNSMAYHLKRGLIDPFDGEKDLRKRLIRAVGDPFEKLRQDPLRILRGIRLAGQLDFLIHRDTLSSMKENAHFLDKISMDRKMEEFEKILVAKNPGRSLEVLLETSALEKIFTGISSLKEKQAKENLRLLIENIHRGEEDLDLRMALVLQALNKEEALEFLDSLNLDRHKKNLYRATVKLADEFNEIVDKYSLKRFIYRNGHDIYDFLDRVDRQGKVLYKTSGIKMDRRATMLEHIIKKKEAIFIEDLSLGGRDLIEAEIAQGKEIGDILKILIDEVHKSPKINTREELLEKAKKAKGL